MIANDTSPPIATTHLTTYRFRFDQVVPLPEVEGTLALAILAVEGLYGPARVRLDVQHRVEPATNAVVIDASSSAGSSLVGIFTSLVLKEFGDDAVILGRVI